MPNICNASLLHIHLYTISKLRALEMRINPKIFPFLVVDRKFKESEYIQNSYVILEKNRLFYLHYPHLFHCLLAISSACSYYPKCT